MAGRQRSRFALRVEAEWLVEARARDFAPRRGGPEPADVAIDRSLATWSFVA
jgi:hypothetical protein